MPILIRDLIDDEVIVYISCQACGRLTRLAGPHLLEQLGRDSWVRGLLPALRCKSCGMLGDMTLKFDRTDLSLERQVRRLDLHDNWPTSALDLADIEDGAQDRIELVCNLYSNTTAVEAMRRLFDVDPVRDTLGNAEPRPAIFPKGAAPVVRLNDAGERELIEMAWGFLTPAFSTKTGNPIKPKAWNNARDDQMLTCSPEMSSI